VFRRASPSSRLIPQKNHARQARSDRRRQCGPLNDAFSSKHERRRRRRVNRFERDADARSTARRAHRRRDGGLLGRTPGMVHITGTPVHEQGYYTRATRRGS